jgi:hypothetical protein
MRLSGRVTRLESSLRTNGHICGGNGKLVVSCIEDDESPPVVEGCTFCGEVFHIIVRGVSMPGPDGKLLPKECYGSLKSLFRHQQP